EPNVVLPDRRPGADEPQAETATGTGPPISLSQGAGSPGSGSMPLYQAVQLASKRASVPNSAGVQLARKGPQYYMFGASGSAACRAAGKFYGFTPVTGQRCLLSGPDTALQALYTRLPPRTTKSQV